ncbi:MAG: DUF433 domain-containing protein [Anaerolineae bacterium]|nr:DUF433 domain-containing protein [Anaerolineae bacterium]
MAEYKLHDRIVISPDVCHGKPRIRGTRIMVYQVLDMLAEGASIETITSEDYFPDLTVEDVLACVGYASRVIQNEDIVVEVMG